MDAAREERHPQDVAGEGGPEQATGPEADLGAEAPTRRSRHRAQEPRGERASEPASEEAIPSEEVLAELLPETEASERDVVDQNTEAMTGGGPIQDRLQPSESDWEVARGAEPEAAREGLPEAQGEGRGTPPGTREGLSTGDEEAAIDEAEKGSLERREQKRKEPHRKRGGAPPRRKAA